MAAAIVRSLLAAILMPPIPAAKLAARTFDVPESALVAITIRESRGQRVGVHAIDAKWSRLACRRARAVGWVADDVDCQAGGWSTRGAFGVMAAYGLRHVGLDRWPFLMDVPIVAAVVAAKRYRAMCPKRDPRWCPRRK